MRAITLVAGAVFRESIRDRVPYTMVVFAVLLMAASFLISQMTAGQDVKIIKDLGLAAVSIFGLLIAVFIGIGLVSKEVERKSIYALLTKPVTRPQFVIGKFAGLMLTLLVNIAAMTVAFYAVLAYMHATATEGQRLSWPAPATDPRLLIAILLIYAELTVVTAVALFFSTFSSPLLATLLTLGLWVAGHFNADLRNFENVVDVAAIAWIAKVAVLHAAEPRAVRREGRGRARIPRGVAPRRPHAGVWCDLCRHHADGGDRHFQTARFQVSIARIAPSNRWWYAAIAALMAVSLAVQVVRDRGWQPYQPPSGVMWIRSGPLAQRLALGFDNLVADVYWMRTVIYYGGQRRIDAARRISTSCSRCWIW